MNKPKKLFEGAFLEFHQDGTWEYVSRRSATGAAHILAVTKANQLILVEQYRIPLKAKTIELPAGVIGDSDRSETVETGAIRELLEETGFQAESARSLMVTPTAPGLTSERFNFVFAEGLTQVSAGGGDADENITVHTVDLNQIDQWLESKAKEGYEVDSRILAGLYLLKQ